MSAEQGPLALPASTSSVGVSFTVAIFQRVVVRLRSEVDHAYRGRVRSISYEHDGQGTYELVVRVLLDEPIRYPATEHFRASEQWWLNARMDEVFPVVIAEEQRDAAIARLVDVGGSVLAALPVLRNMLQNAGLTAGVARADEMFSDLTVALADVIEGTRHG